MKKFPTLYKFAASGSTQQWDIFAEEYDDGTAAYTTTYGMVGGAMQKE